MKTLKRPFCRQGMKAPLNLTALPLAGEGRGEGEIAGDFARSKAHETPAVNRK